MQHLFCKDSHQFALPLSSARHHSLSLNMETEPWRCIGALLSSSSCSLLTLHLHLAPYLLTSLQLALIQPTLDWPPCGFILFNRVKKWNFGPIHCLGLKLLYDPKNVLLRTVGISVGSENVPLGANFPEIETNFVSAILDVWDGVELPPRRNCAVCICRQFNRGYIGETLSSKPICFSTLTSFPANQIALEATIPFPNMLISTN